jgi:hypothetical protein
MMSVETSDDLDSAKIKQTSKSNVYTVLNQLESSKNNAIRVGDTKQVLSFIRISNQISNQSQIETGRKSKRFGQIICSEGQGVTSIGHPW